MAISIAPNSTIKLLYVHGMDNRYLHTYYFASTAAQTSFFNSKVVFTFNANSYTRHTRSYIRLQVADSALTVATMEQYYNCNYMMFQNTNFGSRWFYAFINSVDYINNVTVQINFEIDVMQTWIFGDNFAQNKCLILRRTPTKAENNANTNFELEPISGTNFYYAPQETAGLYDDGNAVIITSTSDVDHSFGVKQLGSVFYEGLFSGVNVVCFECNSSSQVQDIADYLENVTGSTDETGTETRETTNVVSIIQMPKKFAQNAFSKMGAVTEGEIDISSYTWDSVNGYTPKYKKVLDYPYHYWMLTDMDGQNVLLRNEFFNDQNVRKFKIYATGLGRGEIMCYPRYYRGMINDLIDKLVIANFPMCPFSVDSYAAWVAQGGLALLQANVDNTATALQAQMEVGFATSVANMVGAGIQSDYNSIGSKEPSKQQMSLGKGIVGSTVSYASQEHMAEATWEIAKNNYEVQFAAAQAKPDIMVGSISPNVAAQAQIKDIAVIEVGVTYDEAKRIDDFFDMYGYVQNYMDNPIYNPSNSVSGKHMFVKTSGANLSGTAPSFALAAANRILDSGITLWSSSATIGDY